MKTTKKTNVSQKPGAKLNSLAVRQTPKSGPPALTGLQAPKGHTSTHMAWFSVMPSCHKGFSREDRRVLAKLCEWQTKCPTPDGGAAYYVTKMAKDLNINRWTVHKAIQHIVAEGYGEVLPVVWLPNRSKPTLHFRVKNWVIKTPVLITPSEIKHKIEKSDTQVTLTQHSSDTQVTLTQHSSDTNTHNIPNAPNTQNTPSGIAPKAHLTIPSSILNGIPEERKVAVVTEICLAWGKVGNDHKLNWQDFNKLDTTLKALWYGLTGEKYVDTSRRGEYDELLRSVVNSRVTLDIMFAKWYSWITYPNEWRQSIRFIPYWFLKEWSKLEAIEHLKLDKRLEGLVTEDWINTPEGRVQYTTWMLNYGKSDKDLVNNVKSYLGKGSNSGLTVPTDKEI